MVPSTFRLGIPLKKVDIPWKKLLERRTRNKGGPEARVGEISSFPSGLMIGPRPQERTMFQCIPYPGDCYRVILATQRKPKCLVRDALEVQPRL